MKQHEQVINLSNGFGGACDKFMIKALVANLCFVGVVRDVRRGKKPYGFPTDLDGLCFLFIQSDCRDSNTGKRASTVSRKPSFPCWTV